MIKFNYILNDLALSSLITNCLYSENVNYSDKEELENQIKLIQQENKQLKDNWNKLKENTNKALKKIDNMFNEGNEDSIIDDLLELEKILEGSDSNEFI